MSKIIVIGSKNTGGKNDPAVLAQAAGGDVVFWEDLIFDISKGQVTVIDSASGTDLGGASRVLAVNWYKNGPQSIYRDVAYAVALYLKKQGVAFWNSEMASQRSTTKLSATLQLAQEGFDVPKSVFSLSNQYLLDKFEQTPVIIKDVAASRGRHNYLIDDKSQLEGYLADQDGPNRYIMQEFIPNDGDLRIVCFDSKPQLVIGRGPAGKSHLNNTSKGGSAELKPVSDLPAGLAEACQRICQLMGREMAGIDVIPSNDGLSRQVFLEVNAVPQLTSGTYINEKMNALKSVLDKTSQEG